MKLLDRFRLDGKTAVVTGGAGLYGRQIVRGLAEAGARVVVASRDVSKLEDLAANLRSEKLDVRAESLDQSSEASVIALLDRVTKSADNGGRVDVLVNNAVLRPMRDWTSSAEQFAQSMTVNATGLFLMTRAFGEHMAADGRGGSIVNIGSIQGMIGPDYTLYEGLDFASPPDYFFHKGGLIQLTRYAAARLGPRGVRVNAISPGGFYDGQDDRFVKRYNARTFLERMADENDLAPAVVFLASDASSYITGVNLPLDGGYTAK